MRPLAIIWFMIIWVMLVEYSHGENEGSVNEPFFMKSFRNIRDMIRAPFHRIFPATLWCGAGNISDGNGTLGMFSRTDSCCREHDHCELNIAAGGTLHGLKNAESYTSSACTCDHKFYYCLKNVSTLKSTKVGTTYFNILGPKCFLEDYPIMSCKKTTRVMFRERCIEYNKDTSAAKVWQWNDNLVY